MTFKYITCWWNMEHENHIACIDIGTWQQWKWYAFGIQNWQAVENTQQQPLELSDAKLYSGVELRPWTFQWDLTLYLLIWIVSQINRSVHQWTMGAWDCHCKLYICFVEGGSGYRSCTLNKKSCLFLGSNLVYAHPAYHYLCQQCHEVTAYLLSNWIFTHWTKTLLCSTVNKESSPV